MKTVPLREMESHGEVLVHKPGTVREEIRIAQSLDGYELALYASMGGHMTRAMELRLRMWIETDSAKQILKCALRERVGSVMVRERLSRAAKKAG